MESKELASCFANLVHENKAKIDQGISGLLDAANLKGESESSAIGNLTTKSLQIIQTLLKGLTTNKTTKHGYSVALSSFLHEFSDIKSENLLNYFKSLNIHNTNLLQIDAAKLLIISIVARAKRVLPIDMVDELVDIFTKREIYREAASFAILELENPKAIFTQLASSNDVNYFFLSLAFEHNSDTIIHKVIEEKDLIIDATFKKIPKLHSIWNIIVHAANSSKKEKEIWSTFVENDIKGDDALKLKNVQFGLELFSQFLQLGDVSWALTENYLNV